MLLSSWDSKLFSKFDLNSLGKPILELKFNLFLAIIDIPSN